VSSLACTFHGELRRSGVTQVAAEQKPAEEVEEVEALKVEVEVEATRVEALRRQSEQKTAKVEATRVEALRQEAEQLAAEAAAARNEKLRQEAEQNRAFVAPPTLPHSIVEEADGDESDGTDDDECEPAAGARVLRRQTTGEDALHELRAKFASCEADKPKPRGKDTQQRRLGLLGAVLGKTKEYKGRYTLSRGAELATGATGLVNPPAKPNPSAWMC
jgi:hypothetical protein